MKYAEQLMGVWISLLINNRLMMTEVRHIHSVVCYIVCNEVFHLEQRVQVDQLPQRIVGEIPSPLQTKRIVRKA